jgi:6-pyruvoyltetrahydropterin/6-carboxytetrahydropterin synthase
MKACLSKQFDFAAAHRLPNVPPGHKCGQLHGHNYVVEIVVEGEVDPRMGWVIDYGLIKEICKPIIEELDHRSLNDIKGLENPTAEILSNWLWKKIRPRLPLLSAVIIKETCQTACEYRGE